MSLDEYKLSCELHGHSLDVRAVATTGADAIVSGSRDTTAKIWNREGDGHYTEGLTLADHKKFISCLCILNDGGGLICTGSNDSVICVYAPGSVVPLAMLQGHTSTVSALCAGLQPNTLVSGSWDQTARVWQIAGFGPSTSITLVGHEAAVWTVAICAERKQFITGSADKTIAYWNEAGQRLRVLKGHTDCVRALVPLPGGWLLSAGNDAIVRKWSADGECVQESHGHGMYIYTMAAVRRLAGGGGAAGPDLVVTGGEDSTVRMWNVETGAAEGEALRLPAQSVWSVASTAEGDIVTGTSDGVVRVFSRDERRWAAEAVREAFAMGVQTRAAEASLELGGMKVNDLPGPESLNQSGEEGATRIVRHPDGKIMCYQYAAGEWLCVGDVTGAAGGSQKSSGKQLHEGVEYDYVFSVDISDTGAPIKLPYNCSDDPWTVAQRFLHQHELPQGYLEEVANFIIKNSADRNPNSQAAPASAASAYADPFTGEGRYIPGGGGGTGAAAASAGSDFVDPFTGASSYRTAAARQAAAAAPQPAPASASAASRPPTRQHFPHRGYTTFGACDAAKVLLKIREFNDKLADSSLRVSDECLHKIIAFAAPEPSSNATHCADLLALLRWPKDVLFPVLDVVRLAVRDPLVCERLVAASSSGGADLLDQLVENMAAGPANQLMAIRCVANMMQHAEGRARVGERLEAIVRRVNRIMSGSGNLQIAIATLWLNCSVEQLQPKAGAGAAATAEVGRLLTEAVLEFLRWTHEKEAFYRAYQTLGNLTCTECKELTSAQIVSVDEVVERLRDHMAQPQPAGWERLTEVARDLTTAL